MGSEIVVRPEEIAVLHVANHVADALGPGSNVLSTRTIPIATRTLALPFGSGSSFDGAIYFLRTGYRAVERWGTPCPVAFLDNMFGAARVRAHGTVVLRVVNPRAFLRTLGEAAARDALGATLSSLIASRFADALAERVDTLIDLQRYQEELRAMVTKRLETDFALRGMALVRFTIEAMTLPREVMETIESRGSVGSVRQLRDFVCEETTRALVTPGMEAIVPALEEESSVDEPVPSGAEMEPSRRCRACHAMMPDEADFCSRCGEARDILNPCLFCGVVNPVDARYCYRCGESMDGIAACPSCSHPSPPGAHYCAVCGQPMVVSREKRRA